MGAKYMEMSKEKLLMNAIWADAWQLREHEEEIDCDTLSVWLKL